VPRAAGSPLQFASPSVLTGEIDEHTGNSD
jgi:hypothetical protein